MTNSHNNVSMEGLSDLAKWSLGAIAILSVAITSDSLFYFPSQTPFEFHAPGHLPLPSPLSGLVAAVVSFAVAYKSQSAGWAKALSYIALIAVVAFVVSTSHGLYFYGKGWRYFFYDPSGHGLVPIRWVYHHTEFTTLAFAVPIYAGALTGWLLRHLRG